MGSARSKEQYDFFPLLECTAIPMDADADADVDADASGEQGWPFTTLFLGG